MEQPFGPDVESPASRKSFQETILLPLLRSRLLILLCVLVGIGGGLFAGAIRPNEYQSTGKMLVVLGKREQVTADTAVDEELRVSPGTGRDDVQTEVHILNNPRLFRLVAQSVGAAALLEPYDPTHWDGPDASAATRWFHAFQSWWFSRSSDPLADHVCVDPDRCGTCLQEASHLLMARTLIVAEPRTNIISIVHASHDPETAQRVVDAFLEACRDHHLEVFAMNPAYEFLSEQAAEAQQSVARADLALSEYRNECGIYDMATQRNAVLEEIAGLERQDADDTRAQLTTEERIRFLLELLDREPPTRTRVVERTPTANPERQWILDRLSRLKEEREELLTKFREDSEFVRLKDIRIAELESLLAEQPAFVQLGNVESDVANPAYERIRERLDTLREQERGLEAVHEERQERLDELRKRLVTMQQCEPQLLSLERDAAMRREEAQQFATALERARVTHALDVGRVSNLRVVQTASLPWQKAGPDRMRLLLMGVAFGALAGVGLAFARHGMDRTIRRPEDVESLLGLPVLTVIPEQGGWKVRRLSRGTVS